MGRRLKKSPFYTILYLLFFMSVVLPIIYTFSKALFFDTSSSLSLNQVNNTTFFLMGKSIIIAFTIAILSTFLGALLGFILYKTKLKYVSFFKIGLLIPLFISPYILAVAWKDFFYLFFQVQTTSQPYFALILVLTSVYTPLSMLIIGNAFTSINSQLEEAGFLLTSSLYVVLKITLPLVKPALISSFVLVFIFSISEFTVPALFDVSVFTTEIFTQFSAFYNHSLAILQSLFLVLICVFLLFIDRKQLANAVFFSIGNKGTKSYFYDLKNKKILSFLFLYFWFFITVVFPFLMLIIQSFSGGTAAFTKSVSLLLPTFSNSIFLALLAAFVSVFVGFVVAYHSIIQNKSNSFDWFLLVVFAIPSGVLGISFIKFYNQPSLEVVYSSILIIIIAYVGKFSFISSKLIANAFKQIPKSLTEVAQIQGVNTFNSLVKIIIPLTAPALLGAFLLIFVFSFGEVATTIMLYPPGVELMPIKIYTIMANAPQALTSSMVLIMLSTTLLFVVAFFFLTKHVIKNINTSEM